MQKVKTRQEMSQKQSITKNKGRAVEKVMRSGAGKRLQPLQPGMIARPPNGDPTWAMLWGEDR